MTKPSVGRIVHFYTGDASKHSNGQGQGPYVAVVTQTFSDGPYANLKVLPPFKAPYDEGSVLEKGAPNAGERYWEWPPREAGQ